MSKWISVEDKLPETLTKVLVVANDIVSQWQEVLESYVCPEYKTHEWLFLDGEDFPCIVTHWMALPEPPKD